MTPDETAKINLRIESLKHAQHINSQYINGTPIADLSKTVLKDAKAIYEFITEELDDMPKPRILNKDVN